MISGTPGSRVRDEQGKVRGGGLGRWIALACAIVYLSAVWLDAAGVHRVGQALPAPLRFFAQVAELFPYAAEDVIEWHVKGFDCDARQFYEIDVRALFPIHRDDKESRFNRTMFFYFREVRVLKSLDAFITEEYTRQHPSGRIGGVMLLSLRIPIPALGTTEPRYLWRPISEGPGSLTKHYWYTTPPLLRDRRCAALP